MSMLLCLEFIVCNRLLVYSPLVLFSVFLCCTLYFVFFFFFFFFFFTLPTHLQGFFFFFFCDIFSSRSTSIASTPLIGGRWQSSPQGLVAQRPTTQPQESDVMEIIIETHLGDGRVRVDEGGGERGECGWGAPCGACQPREGAGGTLRAVLLRVRPRHPPHCRHQLAPWEHPRPPPPKGY
eukprot:TRINITY_DN3508_c0_g1_i4.p1 TRINITY_DN3508_c0_g1~~TRINITY_DN3508_c0_g1_i4.p1  ORF type:complete len:180 (+),score=50.74 TRINITY_DN3508_c0_g1_i4:1-540(+)